MQRVTKSVQFYCRTSKKDRKGFAPLEVSITINGERVFMSIPQKFRPEEFNQKKQPRHISDYVETWRVKLVEIESELITNGLPVTPMNIKELVRSGGVISYTVSAMAKDFLNDLKHHAETQIYRKYELVFNRFMDFVGDVEITTVTQGQCARFYTMLQQQYKEQTSAGMMQKIKTVFKFAVNEGKLRVSPAETVKISRGKPVVDFLTEEEISRIADADLMNESLERVRDIFIFQCSTGLSYSDVMQLEPDDLREADGVYYIQKRRKKTGVEFTSVVLDRGIRIWEKYHGKLPTISNQKMNLNLHLIQRILGLKKNLHSHLARHSYGCMLLNRGVRLDVVSETLGHSSPLMTKRHYAVMMKSTVLSEVSKAFK